jgi:hypothetical protein
MEFPMSKALLPMLASLSLCGAATMALIATNARADQSGRKPSMIALATPESLPVRLAQAQVPQSAPSSAMRNERMREIGPGREQLCHDLYAGKAGELAFLEAKLSLDAKQAPLFDRWKQVRLDIAKQHESECSGSPPRRSAAQRDQRLNMMDRLAREEEMLKARLADIQSERPALIALYNALTPQQKEEFGRGDLRRMGRLHMMMGMMERHQGMMRHGPMEDPMGAPGRMGEPPEPPPARAQ